MQQLIMFLTGQRTLHHRSDALETVVLVNPSEDTVLSEVGLFYSYRRKVLWKFSAYSSTRNQT